MEVRPKDYQQLWKEVTSATEEAKSVRILATILADGGGGVFVRRLEPENAELCIEILDRVSPNPHLAPSTI